MTVELLYGFLFCIAGTAGFLMLAVMLFRESSPHRTAHARERDQFKAYMRELDAEEAGRELLSQFDSLQELKDANERLRKALKPL